MILRTVAVAAALAAAACSQPSEAAAHSLTSTSDMPSVSTLMRERAVFAAG